MRLLTAILLFSALASAQANPDAACIDKGGKIYRCSEKQDQAWFVRYETGGSFSSADGDTLYWEEHAVKVEHFTSKAAAVRRVRDLQRVVNGVYQGKNVALWEGKPADIPITLDDLGTVNVPAILSNESFTWDGDANSILGNGCVTITTSPPMTDCYVDGELKHMHE